MDPYSLQSRLGHNQFDILTVEQYLAKLSVVADPSASAEEREHAKEDLLNAHFRLIAKTIRRVLDASRAPGGFLVQGGGIGIEGRSDLINTMAGHVYNELTSMAVAAAGRGMKLSSLIAHRVSKRLLSKIRRATAKKRTADFASPEMLQQLAAANEPFDVLERLLLDEAYAEQRATAEALPGNKGLVFQALIYGFETGQDLTVAEIARALGIKETTARSAFASAREELQRRFPLAG